MKRTGLLIDLNRKMTCLNLSRCLSPDSQISISAIIYKVSVSNNDACLGLSNFVGRCIIILWWCMLGGEEKVSRGAGAGSLVCTHPVSLVESREDFMNVVKKCLCVLMIDICKK